MQAVAVDGDVCDWPGSTSTVRAERFEGEQMGVDAAAADDIAAGRGQFHLAQAAQHRPGQEDGGADIAAQFGRKLPGADVFSLQGDVAAAVAQHAHAQVLQQLEHRAHIADAGHIVQRHRFVGEEDGGKHGQRGIFVSRHAYLAV